MHFTSCGTESDNWAISAAVWQGRHTGRHIITTAVEHSAVLEPCKLLQQQGYEVTYLAPDKTGHVTAEQVAQALREDTVLVSMMLVPGARSWFSSRCSRHCFTAAASIFRPLEKAARSQQRRRVFENFGSQLRTVRH